MFHRDVRSPLVPARSYEWKKEEEEEGNLKNGPEQETPQQQHQQHKVDDGPDEFRDKNARISD